MLELLRKRVGLLVLCSEDM